MPNLVYVARCGYDFVATSEDIERELFTEAAAAASALVFGHSWERG